MFMDLNVSHLSIDYLFSSNIICDMINNIIMDDMTRETGGAHLTGFHT
jgi:hypothetical protein